MDSNAIARVAAVDPIWTEIREAAQDLARAEPALASMLHAAILSQPRFESALTYHLARMLATSETPAMLIRQTLDEAIAGDPEIGVAARADKIGRAACRARVRHAAGEDGQREGRTRER